jgi:hypothetical protein
MDGMNGRDNNQVDPKTGLRGCEEREEKGREEKGPPWGHMHDACTMHARTRQQKRGKEVHQPRGVFNLFAGPLETMNEEVNVAAAVGYAKERRANAALALPVAG